ncbi:MAG: FliI/YscN family ATPase [Candidatus Hydrogenedentota bacterium]|nr:MAG: FliI/YscN family ATPase [Candidatus Hydrogenedentota bacterium]
MNPNTVAEKVIRRFRDTLESVDLVRPGGLVTRVTGLVIESSGPPASVGDVCLVRLSRQGKGFRAVYRLAEVIGFRDGKTLLMPVGEMGGVSPGDLVLATGRPVTIPVGPELLGRVLDGLGTPMDNAGPLRCRRSASVFRSPPDPVMRPRITKPLSLGVRAIDGLLTVGKGQRIGIFSGSGVGKSTLLGMMARYTAADVVVVALVGERGREVRDFIERDLGEAGLKKSVVVVATSDKAPLVRIRSAMTATTIAESFRDQGADVLFLMDSVTRYCRALREVALAAGEPPGLRSFPPSVFSTLPRLLERTGTSERGTITALYTVLVDADDMNEPVADNVRGILDGHIVLSRALASRNHYPAIDVLESISRLMNDIVSPEQIEAAGKIKEWIASYRDAEDLIRIGAYVDGADPVIDEAKKRMPMIESFLRQRVEEPSTMEQTLAKLKEVVG